MLRVTCHVSGVRYPKLKKYICFFWTKYWSLSGESLLSTGTTPSSFFLNLFITKDFVLERLLGLGQKKWSNPGFGPVSDTLAVNTMYHLQQQKPFETFSLQSCGRFLLT